MTRSIRFAALLAVSLAASAAFAQGAGLQQLQARFAAADTDHDGKLTPAEAQAGMPRVAQHFAEIDADHKGYLTLEDIERFLAARRARPAP
ncbi:MULTISPECIES: EF-hand domain-containing protein [unclassified Burkholderia]|uniref:EF-hand domain-containing protein n=1 Tax=unclassified Burkholderia TaxID=2613784 RepID=UPI0004A7BE8A|nr:MULTISPECIES: EF-hand domain-containing protein [unclassified Burkholderia]NIE87700.1 EF-hand domain-containing protein [Burkholderia sp. Tr-860]NIF67822.1 EF-hand domain-containing protein [Burkholderia sp. Cy-647]NIF91389.1 EF-hand domain-containing protein [Burkholderia sp. Cy-637]NIG00434.1 EF-hand domain-containing protein [Burkholderia sp. Ax-1720]